MKHAGFTAMKSPTRYFTFAGLAVVGLSLLSHAQNIMPPPKFQSIMPGYAVKDMKVSLDFYTQKLGFKTVFTNGPAAAPVFAIVARDGLEISLNLDRTGERAGTGASYLKLQGIDSLYEEYTHRDVPMVNKLKTMEYEMREFMLKDPDGNTINFGEYVGK